MAYKGLLFCIFRWLILLTLCYAGSVVQAQVPAIKIREIIDQVNLDTLVGYVRILSGEDPVNGRYIINRISGSPTHELAKDYIKQTLIRFGIRTYEQDFTGYSWMGFGDLVSGTNIYAVQKGADTTAEYIICAHYDAVTDFCADDNASGTAVVLEAARIFSRIKPDHTIIYALWDQEEAWLVGSNDYAYRADSLHRNIQGILNLDMLGWDGNGDRIAEIHTRNTGNPAELAERLCVLNSTYSMGLNPVILNPGKASSDHEPFLNRNFPAVLLIEGYSANDFNPYYHTVNDRISKFSPGYFKSMAKLAVGGILSMSSDQKAVANQIEKPIPELMLDQNYPNPVSSNTTIRFYLPERAYANLNVYNSAGYEVASLISDDLERGSHLVTWNSVNFPGGIYWYKLQSGGKNLVRKMVVQAIKIGTLR